MYKNIAVECLVPGDKSHLTPLTPRPPFPPLLEERGPGGEVLNTTQHSTTCPELVEGPSIQHLKLKPRIQRPLQISRQNIPHFLQGFQMVVKHNDRPRPCVLPGFLQAFFLTHLSIIIPAEYSPHDDTIMIFQGFSLRVFDFSIRRPVKIACHYLPALFHILQVCTDLCLPPVQMIVRMISHCMACSSKLLIDLRMFNNIFSNAEESGFDTILIKNIQDDGSAFRPRSVVECQVQLIMLTRQFPDKSSAAEFPEQVWGIEEHRGLKMKSA